MQRTWGVIISYLNIAVSMGVNLLYVPLLLGFIGKSEFGVYQLVGSMIAYFSLLDFGIGSATTKFYAEALVKNDHAEQRFVLGFANKLQTVIAFGITLIGSVFYFYIGSAFENLTPAEIECFKELYIVLICSIALQIPGNIFSSILTSHERFIFSRGVLLVQNIFRPAVITACLFFWPYALTVGIVQLAFNVGVIVVNAWYVFKVLGVRFSFGGRPKCLDNGFFKLAASFFSVFVVDQIFWRTNQVILGWQHGTTEVAIYSIAAVFIMCYMPISSNISSVFFPKVVALVTCGDNKKEISDLFIRIGRYQYLILYLVLIGFIAVGEEFICLWAGRDFTDAWLAALLVIAPFTVDLIQNTAQGIMQAMNCYFVRARAFIFAGILNIVLAIPLGKYYGSIGCAAATGFCMFISNGLIMNVYYHRKLDLDIQMFWKMIAVITVKGIPALLVGIGVNMLWPAVGIVTFCYKVAAIVAAYLVMLWLFELRKDEKEMIWGRFARLIKR